MNKLQREPVAVATAVAAMLEMLILMLVSLGVVPWNEDQVASVNNFIVAFVALAALVVPMYFARRVVTPVGDPRLADGSPAMLVKKG